MTDRVTRFKPPVRLCWGCDRKFHGNHYKIETVEGLPRFVHKEYPKCGDRIEEEDE